MRRTPNGLFPWHSIFRQAEQFACAEMDVSVQALVSKRRHVHLVHARALYVWIVIEFGPSWLSYPIIGHWLGDRHHTTIMHLAKDIGPRLLERDRHFAELCSKFRNQEAATCPHS